MQWYNEKSKAYLDVNVHPDKTIMISTQQLYYDGSIGTNQMRLGIESAKTLIKMLGSITLSDIFADEPVESEKPEEFPPERNMTIVKFLKNNCGDRVFNCINYFCYSYLPDKTLTKLDDFFNYLVTREYLRNKSIRIRGEKLFLRNFGKKSIIELGVALQKAKYEINLFDYFHYNP